MAREHDTLTELFTDIADAIREKTGSTDPIVADEFPSAIIDIPSGGGGWTRPSDWWDTKTILQEAENITQEGITYYPAYIMLLADWDISTEVNKVIEYKSTQGDAFIFSDEPDTLYVGDQTHTWDTTKDKECSEGYKTRYIVVYVTNKTTKLSINLSQFKLIECIFGEFTSTNYIFGAPTGPYANNYLVNFETLDTFLSTTNSGSNAFQYCYSLRSINLPSITSISSSAFFGCYSLTSINLPNVTNVGNYAFQTSSTLTSINLPNATSIGNTVFQSCYSLRSISLPNVTSIGNSAFENCYPLANINLSNATSIGSNAFRNCHLLTNISLPNATSIGNTVFQSCYSLIQLELPNTITSINKTQFTNCKNLRSLILPNEWNFELDVSPCDILRNCLLDIISKLKDITGETAKTFTFGADNLSKLTNEEIAVATDKNWIIN